MASDQLHAGTQAVKQAQAILMHQSKSLWHLISAMLAHDQCNERRLPSCMSHRSLSSVRERGDKPDHRWSCWNAAIVLEVFATVIRKALKQLDPTLRPMPASTQCKHHKTAAYTSKTRGKWMFPSGAKGVCLRGCACIPKVNVSIINSNLCRGMAFAVM